VNVQEQQKDGSRSITVYPNPGTGAFTLNMINGKGVYTLTVYNVMGRIVTSKNVEFSGTGNAQFEIKEKGLYIVSLQNEKVRMTQKVIVE
jgi:5-formaminoimidazole-4-carboxamide-1-beta-D-ribofuranosyl 5'-monophosphate synthetase